MVLAASPRKKSKHLPWFSLPFFSSQQNVVGLPVNSLMSARKQLIVISSGLIHVWRGKPASLPLQSCCSALPLPTGNDKHHSQPRSTGPLAVNLKQRARACVCVFVQLLLLLLCFRYSCMQTCMSACVGLVHTCVCTSISLTDPWLIWVVVCSPASLSHRWSHMIPREPWCCEPSLFLPTRGCVSQLVRMMRNVPVSPKRCQVPSG